MSSIKSYKDYILDPEDGKNRVRGGTLYLVATPIGNLADISYRAVKVLHDVDFIAAEDTRNTPKLLSRYGIEKPLVSYYEHNKRERGEQICARLLAGESCALVTDAGTPAISDPGEDIVRLCGEKNIPVTSIPGPCAAITALTLSGLFTARFVFEGFLSTSKNERKKRLFGLQKETRTIIFYEAPHKLRTTLHDLCTLFADRKIALVRELTKINEEVLRMTVKEACDYYSEREPRGEYVLILSGAPEEELRETAFFAEMSYAEHVAHYEGQGMSRMDAMKAAAKDRGVSKSEIYRALQKTED